ncbi:MAG: helix-turn-helix domain-containing protein [Chloroflexota bacterium]
MTRRRPQELDPRAIAQWRYDQIVDALGSMAHDVRGEVITRISAVPTRWPSGTTRQVSRATVYRWLELYAQGGLAALRPRRRKDRGAKRARLPKDVVAKAREVLVGDPEISFTMLATLLVADAKLRLRARGICVSRSTLQRRLAADPLYVRLQRGRRAARRRTRFVARAPHDIWHLDAKGPITISLRAHKKLVFHIMTVLDDASRATLASVIVLSPDLYAAVLAFRRAAERWGLPGRVYADRASIFDSHAFRAGLADLGAHRIWVKPRNPEANGKIEAFHRALGMWFVKRLPRQVVVDLVHLQQLLDGVLETLYMGHRHRGLATSPRDALGDRVSPRAVSRERLVDAFRQRRTLKAHPKTGEVDLAGKTFLVPAELRGQRLVFLVDPDPDVPPLVVEPASKRPLPVERAAIRSEDLPPATPPTSRWGAGHLQTLYDAWRGQRRPVAEPGFGLPELFALLADATGRPVPRSDAEAARIHHLYRQIGPLPRRATEVALRSIARRVGQGRPLDLYLDALVRDVTHHQQGPA